MGIKWYKKERDGYTVIRVATQADVPEILNIYAPYIQTTTVTFEYTVPSLEEFTERFRQVTEGFPWLLWEEEGKILGYAYASLPFERAAYGWCAEPSIYLRPEARGKHIGRQLYAALEELLEQMGYILSFAVITGENSGSLAFHRAQGYSQCGLFHHCGLKFGRWLDVYWLEKRLSSVEIPRNTPVTWFDFSKDTQKIGNILGKMSLSESGKI